MISPARAGAIAVGLVMLTAPALWNGYPLVFADTGTYISQAANLHLGWDRPVFYSFFLLLLDWRISLWPVVWVQAGLTLWVLGLTRRAIAPGLGPAGSLAGLGGLCLATALPWFASQIMPDLFTGLLVLAIAIAVLAPDSLGRRTAWGLSGFTAFAIAIHQSHLPLALALIAALLALRTRFASPARLDRGGWLRLLGAPALAILALLGMNTLGHHRFAISPYGNVFLLARVLADGPGRDVLARDCPQPGWLLCAAGPIPIDADSFLWRADSPLARAGGAEIVSREADAIIAAAITAEPWREARAMARHAIAQLARFATGDGLNPWPETVSPWIRRDFPQAEQTRYAAARQTRGRWLVAGWLGLLHRGCALAGLLGCLGLIAWPGSAGQRAEPRRRASGFAVAALLGLLFNAAITGALSGPHDRYQARLIWLAPAVAMLGACAARPALRARPIPRPAGMSAAS